MEQVWVEVLQIVERVLPYAMGTGAVFLIQFVKDKVAHTRVVRGISDFLNISEGAFLTILVGLVLGSLYALVEYQIGVGHFDVSNISDIFFAVVSAATAFYFKFYKKEEPVVEEEREELEEVLD